MSNKTESDRELEFARKNAREALDALRLHFERMERDMRGYLINFDNAQTPRDQANFLHFAMGHASSNNNPRLDILASSYADLTQTILKQRMETKFAGWEKIEAGGEELTVRKQPA